MAEPATGHSSQPRAPGPCALLLIAVSLFIGLATFVRCEAINYEDARWIQGMGLLRRAYLEMVPELQPYFVASLEADADRLPLGHGLPQRLRNIGSSLTTTSGVVATLNSALAGSLIAALATLLGAHLAMAAMIGAGVSLLSAALHIRYAARFRRRHHPEGSLGRAGVGLGF